MVLNADAAPGVAFDFVRLSNPLYFGIPNFEGSDGGEAEVFLGAALADLQLTYSMAVSGVAQHGDNRDPWGNYRTTRAAEVNPRPGTPYPSEQEEEDGLSGKGVDLRGVREPNRSYFALVLSQRGGESHVGEIRTRPEPNLGLAPT